MNLTIIDVKDGEAAEEVRKIIEESNVTVTEWAHDPTTKELHLLLEGPEAHFPLRNKLARQGVRPDWVTSAYKV
jgi:hypothetical protein